MAPEKPIEPRHDLAANPEPDPSGDSSVSRRSFLTTISSTLGSAAVIAATPGAAKSLTARWERIQAAKAAGDPAYVRKVLDEHQWRTVSVLCDLIIPADERSGSATDSGAPACIDDWIEFYEQQDGNDRVRTLIFAGLAWLDRESQALFQNDFADAAPEQQKQIIDRLAWPALAAREDHPWVQFFDLFRYLTVAAFFSSKMGVADLPYIGNTFNPNWSGCDPAVWATIEQRLKSGFTPIKSAGPPPKA
jgi:hypothetical protein